MVFRFIGHCQGKRFSPFGFTFLWDTKFVSKQAPKVSLETLHNRNPQNSVLPAFLWALPLLQGFSLKSFMYQSVVVLKEHFRNSETWTSRKRNSVAFEPS